MILNLRLMVLEKAKQQFLKRFDRKTVGLMADKNDALGDFQASR